MPSSQVSEVPTHRSLASYHQERSVIYAFLARTLCAEDDESDGRFRGEHSGVGRAYAPEVSSLLRDVSLELKFVGWKEDLPSEVLERLAVLRKLRDLAASCARALVAGDVASASELWDEQSLLLRGPDGALLTEVSIELESSPDKALVQAGRVLRRVLEDDAALSQLVQVIH